LSTEKNSLSLFARNSDSLKQYKYEEKKKVAWERKKVRRVIDLCCVISGIVEFSEWSCFLLKCTLKCKERRRKKVELFLLFSFPLSETKKSVSETRP